MITYLKRKFKKILLKRTFKEYGFEIKRFQIHELGEIEYAQWSHPFERPKVISTSNITFPIISDDEFEFEPQSK